MAEPVPAQVVEAAVHVCGAAFHYKAELRSFLVASGVPADMYDRWSGGDVGKYVIARHLFADLAGRGPAGQDVLRRAVVELAEMAKPNPAAPDQAAGRRAISELRQLALAGRVLIDPDAAERAKRRAADERKVARRLATRDALDGLARRLANLVASKEDPHRRGYELEKLLADLLATFELDYRPSYRNPREQIDGAFDYKSFTYLVEARWRSMTPSAGDLADFKMKVDGKLESTRGVFLSMAGFDAAVVDYFTGAARGGRNNLLLGGLDLTLILQGQVDLRDALDYKIQQASDRGRWWAPLSERP